MPEWLLSEIEQNLPPLEMLQRLLPEAPTAYLRQLLRSGKVLLDEVPLDAKAAHSRGRQLQLPRSKRLASLLAASGPLPEVLLETAQLLVVFKPAGLAVHRGAGHEEDNLVRRVEKLLKRNGAPFRAAPVHRLDRDTSGPVLFGKGRQATGRLGRLFMQEPVEKVYLALAGGIMPERGALLSPVPAKGKLKQAETTFRVLDGTTDCSLVELTLHTGRTHQIRRQMAAAGHPLMGDRRYGGVPHPALKGAFLHCRRLALRNPFDDSPLAVEVPLPSALHHLLVEQGLHLSLAAQPE